MTTALEGGEWSALRPGGTLPPGKTQYPFYRMLGGPQGRSGKVENLVSTGIRSRTVQPVVSRYTEWATRPIFTEVLIEVQVFCDVMSSHLVSGWTTYPWKRRRYIPPTRREPHIQWHIPEDVNPPFHICPHILHCFCPSRYTGYLVQYQCPSRIFFLSSSSHEWQRTTKQKFYHNWLWLVQLISRLLNLLSELKSARLLWSAVVYDP